VADRGLEAADAFAWALRLLRASAARSDYGQANVDVQTVLASLDEADLREVAAALALLPRFAARPLTEQRELDRLTCVLTDVFS